MFVQPRRFAIAALLALVGCQSAPPPDPTGRANPEMLEVLAALASMNPKPIESLAPDQARLQPTAAMAAMRVQAQKTGSAAPMPIMTVRDITVMGAAGPLMARLYDAVAAPGPRAPKRPLILYFQGGGWVIANLETYDASARALAAGTGAIVVSVQYRKGPETRFPGAHDDAVAAYRWALANAAVLGADPRLIALAGESAGGNLAVATGIAARDLRLPMPAAILSIYPVAGTSLDTPSALQNKDAKPLDTAMLPWFLGHYTNGTAQEKQDTRLNLLGAELQGLPPTTIILADIDPLRSGGETLADRMAAAGVPTTVRTYPGVTHEFFGMGSVVGQAKTAEDFASDQLRDAFMHARAMERTPARNRYRGGA